MGSAVEYYILMGNLYIKRIVDNDSFYLLNQNFEWLDYPSLVDMFYDPSVEQEIISCEDVEAEIERLTRINDHTNNIDYSEITYLDENDNLASKDNYYRSIITVYKNGKIEKEVFSFNPDKVAVKETNKDINVKIIYVDDDDIEVPEEEATYCITHIFENGNLVGNYKDKLYKGK